MNPPYEGGADGRFIEKAMDESDNVIALCRLNFFSGKDRYSRVWSRIGVVENGLVWSLARVAFFVSRPSFLVNGEESGPPASDYVAVYLTRREEWLSPVNTRVEWWT